MTRDQIQGVLRQPYDRQSWLQVLRDILPGTDIFGQAQPITIDHHIARHVAHLGRVRLNGGRQLAILEIDVADRVDIARNRVGLRNFVSRFIDQERAHGVLAVFRSTGKDYRFTFVARESTLTDDGTLATKETATRRFTYVLGPKEPCRTPAQRFATLAAKGDATLEDVTDAFSVEKLNREFFDTYKSHYQKFCAHLLDGDAPAKVFDLKLKGLDDKARDLALKPVRDFVKKLLGRLVFLHFLQKKGWLGCPANATNWKNGDPIFLKNLFDTAPATEQQRFHSRCLVPLFFETLNKKRKGDIFEITGTRVPYLNGGLFERDFENVGQIDFSAELFHDLLEFFDQYNFTIDENDPDDHEIGIDPEMLGHIFENLLEDNKDKGAFYTPKAIVQYMCQQSLIYYLKQHLGDRPEIETLVRRKDVGDPQAKDNWIRQNARPIAKLLDQVKICDPAIGSGAFPIGLLQEIYWLKLSLDWTLDRAKAKRDIIQHSIYGVDIDAGAVEIARLRFWLALVVEENTPRPLPNLDYKIMQGNSLLESFEGIDLSNLTGKKRQTVQLLGTEQTELGLKAVSTELTVEFAEGKQQEIGKLIHDYFDQDDHEQKQALHRKIDKLVLGHIEYNLDLHEERTQAVLDNARKELKRKQAAARGYQPTKKEAARIAELEAQLAEVDRKRDKLAGLQEKPERPFFLWHLFFQDVFTQGGFDIVIANPPYVRQESIKGQKAALQAEPYECFEGTADLLVYFYERAVKLLRPNAVLTFITSNKFYRASYGEKLRGFLTRELTLNRLIDFGDAPVFEAIAYASILTGVRTTPPLASTVIAYTWEKNLPLDKIAQVVVERGQRISQGDLKPDGWHFKSPLVRVLHQKMESLGIPLGRYVGELVFNGVKSGHKDAFTLSPQQRKDLVANEPASKSLLKPLLKGRDIKRWKVDKTSRWLLYIPWHFPYPTEEQIDPASDLAEVALRKRFPVVFAHLSTYRDELLKRDQSEIGIRYEWFCLSRPRSESAPYFDSPKIVFPDIAIEPSFAWDTNGHAVENTAYFIPGQKWLLAVLNSQAAFWFFRQISNTIQGGFVRFIRQYIEQIPIPQATSAQQKSLERLVDRILDAKAEDPGADVSSLEREVDEIVYSLYALTPEEIALVQSATAPATRAASPSASRPQPELKAVSPYFTTAARTTLYDRVLAELKAASPYFTTEAIKQRARQLDPEINLDSLAVYLSESTAAGLIHDAGRGWYSSLAQELKLDTKPVAPVVRLLEKKFPLLEDFNCWNTAQVNPWMHHLIAKGVTFVNTDPDALDAVWECLREAGYDAHLNPTGKAKEQFAVRDKAVVVRRRVSGAPVDGHFSRLETVLVDLLLESERLRLMDKSEFQRMAEAAVISGRISVPELMNYAENRKQNWRDIFAPDAVKQRHLFEKGGVS